jgi:hypothetical protein
LDEEDEDEESWLGVAAAWCGECKLGDPNAQRDGDLGLRLAAVKVEL